MKPLIWKSAFLFWFLGCSPQVCAQTPDKSGVSANSISLPSGPGSIEGLGESFEPQLNTGTSSYSVGFELPPGRVGFAPSLGLSYNSGLGNSCVGIGWSLNVPQIKRQTDKGFPNYNDSDTFIFQGEELVALSDGTFRCENETGFQRFRKNREDGAWEMTTRDGTVHIFGAYHDDAERGWSAVEHPDLPSNISSFNRTYCWALNSSTDLHGNRIEYHYTLGTGMLFLTRVTYAHSGNHAHEVILKYDQSRPDVFDDYRPTFSAQIDRRLSEVIVQSAGQRVRSYNLAYDYDANDIAPLPESEREALNNSFDLGVSVLKKVTQFDRTGENHLPPLIFYYSFLRDQLADAEIQSLNTPPQIDLAGGAGVQLADINADGLPDIFSTTEDTFVRTQTAVFNRGLSAQGQLTFSSKEIVAQGQEFNLAEANTALGDLDADGVIDCYRLTDDGFGKRLDFFSNRSLSGVLNAEQGFVFEPSLENNGLDHAPSWVSLTNSNTRQVDLNFDKTPDFLHTTRDFSGLNLVGYYRNKEGLWERTSIYQSGALGNSLIPREATFSTNGSGRNPAVHLADMNGDRLQDFVYLERRNGPLFSLRVRYWPYCALGQWGEERVFDLTGDDAFQIDNLPLENIFVQDFTGDGLADILTLDGSGTRSRVTLRANIAGQTWSTPVTKSNLPPFNGPSDASPTAFRTADLNGNGSTDLIWRNTGFDDGFAWLDLMPDAGKPNLLTRIDNSLGKVTTITYGNAHEDYVRAQNAGHPWITKIPFAVQVVRRMVTNCGYDLNGDGLKDHLVSEFSYRDGYYDGFEKEFRGFAFAERIDYGDDFLWDEEDQAIAISSGWDRSKSPTGQVSGPSSVTRYRFHTGAPDGFDNDERAPADAQLIDEFTEIGGREEEVLKGKQLLEEHIDASILHDSLAASFDAACAATGNNLTAPITDDKFVYQRLRQFWKTRRLYRPTEELQTFRQEGGDTFDLGKRVPVPSGRFTNTNVIPNDGRSVSFAFPHRVEAETIEANGALISALGHPERSKILTRQDSDFDDYGNQTFSFDHGIMGGGFDDERKVTTTYALGGNALSKWIISMPNTVTTTDENDTFVNKTINYYDGTPYVGVAGPIGDRALLHRTQSFIDPSTAIDATRSRYDTFGNLVESRDPDHGTEFSNGGHHRIIGYDETFNIYPTSERIVVGGDSPDLVLSATYDLGFGTVESSTDFNDHLTDYEHDSFARLVAITKPGDTIASPTFLYEYQAFDPLRSDVYSYARSGALSLGGSAGQLRANRVTSHSREKAGGGVYTTAEYSDGCGKPIASVGEDEDSGKWVVSSATSHNLRGAASASWLPYTISSADIPTLATIWPNGRPPTRNDIVKTDTLSDTTGRAIRTIHPPENSGGVRKESFTHHLPFETQLFDENDADSGSIHVDTPFIQFIDGLGRLIQVDEKVKITDEGEVGSLATWSTQYRYDLNDKLTRITDSQNNIKRMEYDGLARLTHLNDPDRGTLDYLYTPASNLRQTTDAKGQVITYTHDGANRIKTEDYLDSAGLTPDVEYFYDVAVSIDQGDGSHGAASNPKGQLVKVRDLTGESHYSYDSRARLEWQIKRVPDHLLPSVLISYKTSYTYDSLDRVTDLLYPDGDGVRYGYNNRNLLESISGDEVGSFIQDINYRASSQIDSITYGNGVESDYDYDPRLRLRELDTTSPAQPTPLIDFSYGFDPASNITRIDDNRDLTGQPQAEKRKNTQVFTYDSLYRLTQVKYPTLITGSAGTIDYRFDRIGNMLSKTSNITHEVKGRSITDLGTMSYGSTLGRTGRDGASEGIAGPHALTGVSNGSRSYGYDANGNMENIDGLTCSWDFKDRLASVENEKMRADYRYDYADRRVIKQVTPKTEANPLAPPQPTATTLYINRYFEVRPGEPPVKYIWRGDTRVARVTGTNRPSLDKTQHLRLHEGWNLCTVVIENAAAQIHPDNNERISQLVWWDEENQLLVLVESPDTTIPAPAVVWIAAKEDAVITLTGPRPPPSDQILAANRGHFVRNTLDAPVDLAALPESGQYWHWQAESQNWGFRYPELGLPTSATAGFDSLAPGRAFFGRLSDQAATLDQTPDTSLQVRYYHQDHLGSSSVISDQHGELVEEIANYPFGYPRNTYRPRGVSEAYGFTQKEQDSESELHSFGIRSLASNYGRFLSYDPILDGDVVAFTTDPQRWNPYSYSGNRPLVASDESGHAWGLIKKVAKVVINGGDLAATMAGAVEDVSTILDPNVSWTQKAVATVSLASEFVSPVSLKEAQAGVDFAKKIHSSNKSSSIVSSSTKGGVSKSTSPKRRTQTAGDVTLPSEKAARREAIRRHGGETSKANNFTRKDVYGQNSNLRGPEGEPSEVLSTKHRDGRNIEIEHHKHGHQFKDDNTYELPHYQGPKGEHISYEKK